MKDYRLRREKLFLPIVPPTILCLVIAIDSCMRTRYMVNETIILVLSSGYLCMYLIFAHIKRYLFFKKGVAYKGKVVEYVDYSSIKVSTYCVYIQLQYEGKKKIIKSGKFGENPRYVLCSDKCTVLVRKGKFYPCMFDYSKKKADKKIKLPERYK